MQKRSGGAAGVRSVGVALVLAAGTANAAWINYNFYNSAGTPAAEDPALLTGPADGSGETWNQGNGTSGSGLLDSNGMATAVGFTIPTANRWNWGSPDLKMIHGGAAQFTKGQDSTFTITGLTPDGLYDVWLASYAHNSTLAERAVGEWSTTNATATFGPQKIDGRDHLNGTTWEYGVNYVKFESVVASGSGGLVFFANAWDLSVSSGDEWRLPLNGFQISTAAPREPLEIVDFLRQPGSGAITLIWKSNPGEMYGLYWATNLSSFVPDVHCDIIAHGSENRTTLGPIPTPDPAADRLFLRLGPPDLADPVLIKAWGNGSAITMTFSEAMKDGAATNAANFSVAKVGGGTIGVVAATLGPDGKTIVLTLAASLEIASSYTVTIYNLTDLAGRTLGEGTEGRFKTYDNNPNGVKVFILAGQSNMVGHGKREQGVDDIAGAIGGLRYMVVNDATTNNYRRLLVDTNDLVNSVWVVRDDVKVWWRYSDIGQNRAVAKGDLDAGFAEGRNIDWFGPEYGFGWVLGDVYTNPVLLIKTAWGGKSLAVDFRPPSAVAARGGVVGPYYTGMLEYVRDVLHNLETEFPEWAGQGYQIAGIGWHQGWNDRIDATYSAEYEANLVDLIDDLRAEFGRTNLAFSIGTTGMAPPPAYTVVENAQLAVGNPILHPEFAGTVFTVDARPFWRDASISPSNFGYHWNHNGESHFLLGEAMGRAMQILLGP